MCGFKHGANLLGIFHPRLKLNMGTLRAVLFCAFASLGICARCVYGIEESAIVEWNVDSFDLPNPLSRYSYDSPISPHDRVVLCVSSVFEGTEEGDNISDESSYNDVLPSTSYTRTYGPRSCALSFGREGFIRSHANTRTDSYVSGDADRAISKFGFFGGSGSGGSNAETLNKLIDENRTSGGVLLVDFYANWCQPCVAMKSNLQVIENQYKPGKLVIHKVDVDENQELCTDYEIRALPTLIFFSRGNIVKRVQGLVDITSLTQMIDEILDQSS